jgi:hypothetical protein
LQAGEPFVTGAAALMPGAVSRNQNALRRHCLGFAGDFPLSAAVLRAEGLMKKEALAGLHCFIRRCLSKLRT